MNRNYNETGRTESEDKRRIRKGSTRSEIRETDKIRNKGNGQIGSERGVNLEL